MKFLLRAMSAGEFFELMRPLAYIIAALLSAWTLASARKQRLSTPVTLGWTVGTLVLPPVVFPVYLIYRLFTGSVRASEKRTPDQQPPDETTAGEPDAVAEGAKRIWMRRSLPFLYLFLLLAAGAFSYYQEQYAVDSYLARANQARLKGDADRIVAEYRSALRIEDNAHTHNLLGKQFAAENRWEEALAEFRAAEQGGEPDDAVYYNLGVTLDALNRRSEAIVEYSKFLATNRCKRQLPDTRCENAGKRIMQQ